MKESQARPREYCDANGVRWRVRELHPGDRSVALYFESDAAFRRVTEYPNDWRELPTSELEIISLRT
jgi:hypothetical protein